MEKVRTLYYVPIIHTLEDFGNTRILEFKGTLQSEAEIAASQQMIKGYWAAAEAALLRLLEADGVNFKTLQIYADSFPIVAEEVQEKVLNERCEAGIPWCLIIQKLNGRGGKLMGTEDLQLYLREAQAVKEAIERLDIQSPYAQRIKTKDDTNRIQAMLGGLEERDRFIAKRIDETLEDIGVLFMGLGHKVIEALDELPSKFRVIALA